MRGLRLPRRRRQDGAPVAGCHCPHGCAEGVRATLLSPRKAGARGQNHGIFGVRRDP